MPKPAPATSRARTPEEILNLARLRVFRTIRWALIRDSRNQKELLAELLDLEFDVEHILLEVPS